LGVHEAISLVECRGRPALQELRHAGGRVLHEVFEHGISAGCALIHPTRHPVIAQFFENVLT
jgi:hypothetical protein